MLHTLCFSDQNAVYFIMLPFLVPVLFIFNIQGTLKFKYKTLVPKDESLLGYYAMLPGKQLLLFREIVVHLSGG
jgi:hypothetical protein